MGVARLGSADTERLGTERIDADRKCRCGVAWHGKATSRRHGWEWQGVAVKGIAGNRRRGDGPQARQG